MEVKRLAILTAVAADQELQHGSYQFPRQSPNDIVMEVLSD
jgi:hypothetical protein